MFDLSGEARRPYACELFWIVDWVLRMFGPALMTETSSKVLVLAIDLRVEEYSVRRKGSKEV